MCRRRARGGGLEPPSRSQSRRRVESCCDSDIERRRLAPKAGDAPGRGRAHCGEERRRRRRQGSAGVGKIARRPSHASFRRVCGEARGGCLMACFGCSEKGSACAGAGKRHKPLAQPSSTPISLTNTRARLERLSLGVVTIRPGDHHTIWHTHTISAQYRRDSRRLCCGCLGKAAAFDPATQCNALPGPNLGALGPMAPHFQNLSSTVT